ncbi:MAG: hypothetical protein AAGE84_30335 [Cyanobacteria bacterium P01_G01_bin.39]
MRTFNNHSSRQRIVSHSILKAQNYSRSSSTSQSRYNISGQQASINVGLENLGRPFILKIETSSSPIDVRVKINEITIKKLNSGKNQLNLSPFLLMGKNVIEISTPYSLSLSSIKVELLGPNINVCQQTSGTGVLNHTLVVIVR